MIYFVCITYFSSLSQGSKIFKELKFSQINRNPGRGGEEGGKEIIHNKTSCMYSAWDYYHFTLSIAEPLKILEWEMEHRHLQSLIEVNFIDDIFNKRNYTQNQSYREGLHTNILWNIKLGEY